jgi:hypothetical protein
MTERKILVGFLAVVRKSGQEGMELSQTYFKPMFEDNRWTLTPENWKDEITPSWYDLLEEIVSQDNRDLGYVIPGHRMDASEAESVLPSITMVYPIFLPSPLVDLFEHCENLVEGIAGHRDFPMALADFFPLGRREDLPSLTDLVSALTAEILNARMSVPDLVPYGKTELEVAA